MDETSLLPFIEEYNALFEHTWSDDTPSERVRFVVLDSETTGADARTAKLITIGAVAVVDGEIVLADAFEELIWTSYNSPSVSVHGITRDETRDGVEEAEALESFLKYLRDGVIVGHHIDHDIITISRATERHFGVKLQNQSLDTMDLTLHLKDDGAFFDKPELEDFSLDALCDLFGIEAHDRHTAGGDAFITAQIFLRLLRLARKASRKTLRSLTLPYSAQE
ncbi:MAG TPA: 3'-5' exonuclease [Terriglobales bacterium]|nr:3'-5' exonuclease [Terriglobales bacterium]